MSVRIRLARGGSKKRPVHKIVVADKRAPRDGRFIEALGSYNPLLPKDHADALRVNVEAAKKWMAQGAELTERVQKLFALIGLAEKPAIHEQPKKSAPKAKAQERLKEAQEKAAAAREAEEAAKAAQEQAAETSAESVEATQAPETPTESVEATQEQPAE